MYFHLTSGEFSDTHVEALVFSSYVICWHAFSRHFLLLDGSVHALHFPHASALHSAHVPQLRRRFTDAFADKLAFAFAPALAVRFAFAFACVFAFAFVFAFAVPRPTLTLPRLA